MAKDRDLMLGLEEEEKGKEDEEEEEEEEDEIEEQRNKRILVDVTSEKTDDKAPAGLTDSSADKVFDEQPHRKTVKLLVNSPRSSPDKESPKKPIKLMWKHSSSSPKLGPGSSKDESHKSRALDHVGAGSGAKSTDAKTSIQKLPSLGHLESIDESFETLSCEDKDSEGKSEGAAESPELAQIRSPLTETCLESHQNYLESLKTDKKTDAESSELAQIRSPITEACLESHRNYLESLKTDKKTDAEPLETHKKKDYSRSKRKRHITWANEEIMLLFLKDAPHLQLNAVCALHRDAIIKLESRGTTGLPDSVYAKLTRIAEFLTGGDAYGRCIRTSDELEEIYGGGNAYCSWLVSTYSRDLYHIYLHHLDTHFC